MPKLVGVRFRLGGRVHYCDPADLDLSVGDRVTDDTDLGPREGSVVIAPDQVLHSDLRGPLDRVSRREDDASPKSSG